MGEIILESNRLKLRVFRLNDLEAIYSIRKDPDVMKYIGDGQPSSKVQVEKDLIKLISDWNKSSFTRFAVILKEKEELIGWCGLAYLDKTPEVEIGYGIAKQHWNKGLITEAAKECIKDGFERLKLDKISAVAIPANIGSTKVMENIGMKFNSIARFYNKDVAYYSITKDEYINKYDMRDNNLNHVI